MKDQGQLDKDLEDWLYPRGSQPHCNLFSEEDKQELIQIEGLDPEVAIIINQPPEV